MTRQVPIWQQAGSYPAGLDRQLLLALWPTGGVVGLAVSAVPGSMDLQIAAGSAAVPMQAGQGATLCVSDAVETATLDQLATSGETRIDLLVAQVHDDAVDGGGINDFAFEKVVGVPSTTPPAIPATPPNALALSQITVVGGAANLDGATLRDVRRGMAQGGPRARAYVGNPGGVSCAGNGYTTIPFDTVAFDPWGMLTVAARGFTVPVSGVYRAYWQVTCAGAGNNPQRWNAVLMLAGAFAANGSNANTTSGGPVSNGSDLLVATAGQVVTVQVFNNGPNAAPLGVLNTDPLASNYLTVEYVGPLP